MSRVWCFGALRRRKPELAAAAPGDTPSDPPTPAPPPPRRGRFASLLLRFAFRAACAAALLTYLAAACICLSPALQTHAAFLHRVSRVWPPCAYEHPERNATWPGYPRLSRLLELTEGLPNTVAHRLPLDGEGLSLGMWHTQPALDCAAGDGSSSDVIVTTAVAKRGNI